MPRLNDRRTSIREVLKDELETLAKHLLDDNPKTVKSIDLVDNSAVHFEMEERDGRRQWYTIKISKRSPGPS